MDLKRDQKRLKADKKTLFFISSGSFTRNPVLNGRAHLFRPRAPIIMASHSPACSSDDDFHETSAASSAERFEQKGKRFYKFSVNSFGLRL